MSAINPTDNTALIVDEFISYAINHLNSVKGTISTISLYTAGPPPSPVQIPGPGILNWTGYFVSPSTPSKAVSEDDFVPKEDADIQESVKLDKTESIQNGITEQQIDSKLEEPDDLVISESTDVVVGQVKFNSGKPFVTGFRAGGGGGGFSGGSGGITSVDLGSLDFSADWITLSSKFIGKNEGFAKAALNDEGTPRLGFGSDKILDASTGKIRDVKYGDVTTVDAALKVLQYEVSVSYKARLVGTGDRKISEADFNALSNKQKAACMSFVYNCGSLRPGIAAAIRSKDYAGAANGLLNGPTTGAASGTVYPGLVRRRKEEATMFST
jgi:GH24 family phage-related lysozyme (muramidase)